MKNLQLPQSYGASSLNVEISTLEKTIQCKTSPTVHRSIEVPDDTILVVVDAYSPGKEMIASWGISFKENDGLWRKFTPDLHTIEILRAELAPKPEPEPEVNPGLNYPTGWIAPEARKQEAGPVEAKKKKRKLEDESNSASM